MQAVLLAQATTRSSLAAEQLGHRLLMRDRTGPAGRHPFPVSCHRRFYLSLLQQLSRRVALHCLQSLQGPVPGRPDLPPDVWISFDVHG